MPLKKTAKIMVTAGSFTDLRVKDIIELADAFKEANLPPHKTLDFANKRAIGVEFTSPAEPVADAPDEEDES
jgi:hypothetical protein